MPVFLRGAVKKGEGKHDVAYLHCVHPDWTAPMIAMKMGVVAPYVRTTAKRLGITLPKKAKRMNSVGKDKDVLYKQGVCRVCLIPLFGSEDKERDICGLCEAGEPFACPKCGKMRIAKHECGNEI